MRVAMLIWSYWPGHEGGAERQCRKIIPHLEKLDLKIVVWTAWTQLAHPCKDDHGSHEILRLGKFVPFLLMIKNGLTKLQSRFAKGCQTRYQIASREAILFWLGFPFVFLARCSFLFELWLLLRKPDQRPDLIHVHESSWMAGAAAFLAKKYRIPVLAKTALYPAWDKLGYDVPFRGTFSRARRTCSFVALAPYLAADLIGQGINQHNIHIVPNGVEIPEIRENHYQSETILLVANFSQGVEHKAFDVMLDAWSLVVKKRPSARLLLLGAGESYQWIEMVQNLRLDDSVCFLGWVPDPSEYYLQASIFVLPSRKEGISNALLEAQSWALPCVVTDIPGNLAVIKNEQNGIVVPVNDSSQLAAAILRLMCNPELRRSIGQAGRARMVDDFSMGSISERLKSVYIHVTRKNSCAL